jgi:hypothetical protein
VTLLLAGCSGPPVAAREVSVVDAWVRKEQLPARTEPVAMWYGDGNVDGAVCGEIVAPEALREERPTLRFVYGPPRIYRGGQVELHEGWQATGIARTTLEANRTMFNTLWNDHCAAAAPLSRRLAALTGWPVHRWWRESWAARERSVAELRDDLAAQRRAGEQVAHDLREAVR